MMRATLETVVLADRRWRVASKVRPPHDLVTTCKCGVSGEKFNAKYVKARDRWFLGDMELVFGNRSDDLPEGPDLWKPKNKLKSEK